jgi:hypothetical protein
MYIATRKSYEDSDIQIMRKILIGLILGVLLTGISTKFLIDTALFRVTYCNWDAVENLKFWRKK